MKTGDSFLASKSVKASGNMFLRDSHLEPTSLLKSQFCDQQPGQFKDCQKGLKGTYKLEYVTDILLTEWDLECEC